MVDNLARPVEKSIEYYPMNSNFLNDIKIRRIIKACGATSIAILLCLLGNIYGDEGYYMVWNEDVSFLIADSLGVNEGLVIEVVKKAVQVEFFDKNLFARFKILSSKGIQRRYLKATEKRANKHLINEYLLVSAEETPVSAEETPVSAEETPVSAEESTQSKVKESKVKESKVKESKVKENTPPLYSKLPKKGGGVLNNDDVDVGKLKKLISLYNYCGFQNVSPSVQDTLVEFSKQYPYSWLEEAFKIATNGGKLSLNYIKGILNRWQTNGKNSDFKNNKTDVENYYDQVDKWTAEIEREMANNGY